MRVTHGVCPAEDIGVEAGVVLGDVEASLDEDLFLKGA